jgi:enamine deaminase RidA (YjgF/YER057c/UK114 family)
MNSSAGSPGLPDRPVEPGRPRYVNPSTLPPPRGFNHGVLFARDVGDMLFVAGQIGCDAVGTLVGDDFVAQFEQALVNVLAVVRTAGGRPDGIGKMTIYITDKAEYIDARRALGESYRRHMGRHFPAISLVEVRALLDPGAKVEIEAVAQVAVLSADQPGWRHDTNDLQV